MSTKVSVTTASHATSAASRSSDTAPTRDSPAAVSAAKGFSSVMSAAARPPAPHDPGSDTRAQASRTTNGNSGAKSSGPTTTASAQPAKPGSEQAPTAAATVAEADVSSIDADLATAEGKTAEKGASKSRTAGTDSSSTSADAATLALLLAASGMQVDGRTGPGQQSQDGDAGSAADDNTTTTIGGNSSVSSLANAGIGLAAMTAPAASGAAGAAAITTTAAASAVETALPAQVAQLSVGSLSVSSTLSDQSGAGSSLAQDNSAAPGSTQAQPTASTTPNGIAQMIRDLTSTQSASVERTIAMPVSDRNWSGAVAGQVQWMVGNNVQSATLQLWPEHLGPVEVRIDMQPSQVNVSFTASHPDTRSALEQSVPQLRAILAHGGLTLGQTTVQQQEARSGSQYAPHTPRGSTGEAQNVESVSVSSVRGLGLLDEYA
jgi:flagellar hook-length control protein FliK